MLNRSLVIIHPKKPFFEWLRSLPDPCDLTEDAYEDDSTAYLIPEYEDDSDLERQLIRSYDVLFCELLSGWWTVEKDWPQNRTFEMFREWFGCEFHSLVIDLVDAPLITEE